MANDWTRLLQETSRRGGPDGLKGFYENRGKLEGAGAMLLLAAGVGLLVKAVRSFAQAKAVDVPAPAHSGTPGFDDGTSVTEAAREDDEPAEGTPAGDDRPE